MAEYQAIIIQQIGDQEQPYAYATSDSNGNTVEDKFDHGMSHGAVANGIMVYKKGQNDSQFVEVLRDTEVEITMTVTDCRVIYRCDKYDKGDRKWSGGLTAVALNAYEKSKANKRSAGKVLLGHIRYEWISEIQYLSKNKNGFFDYDDFSVSLVYKNSNKTTYIVKAKFNKGMDTAFIANEILHAASKYRLAMQDEKGDREIEFFEKYSEENIPKQSDPKEESFIRFPNHYYAPRGEQNRPNW